MHTTFITRSERMLQPVYSKLLRRFLCLGFIASMLIAPISLSAQQAPREKQTCDSMQIAPLDGTVHARYFDPDSKQEKDMKLVFSEGVLKELSLDGKLVSASQWDKYTVFVNGIRQDYMDSQRDLCAAEMELQRAEEEMQKTREEMKGAEFHVLFEGIGIALAEARRSLQELDRMHGDEVRLEIAKARIEIQKASEEFRRNDLPEIQLEIGRLLDHVQEALQELEESQQEEQHNQSGHSKPPAKEEKSSSGKNMESTLDKLEKK